MQDYLRDYPQDCPVCSARQLTRNDWSTYIYLLKSVRLQSASSAIAHAEM